MTVSVFQSVQFCVVQFDGRAEQQGQVQREGVKPQSFRCPCVVVFAETEAVVLPSVSSSLLPLSLEGCVGGMARS